MDKVKVQKIRFQGLDFVLTSPDEDSSPIATVKQYQNGECSYAHFDKKQDKIYQHHRVIGTSKDIEFGKIIEIEMSDEKFSVGIGGETWPYIFEN